MAWNVAKGPISYSMFSDVKPLTKRKKDQLVILFIHMENPQIGFQYLIFKSLSILMNSVYVRVLRLINDIEFLYFEL